MSITLLVILYPLYCAKKRCVLSSPIILAVTKYDMLALIGCFHCYPGNGAGISYPGLPLIKGE